MRYLHTSKATKNTATDIGWQPIFLRGDRATVDDMQTLQARLHALIIGIDKYLSNRIVDLRGATSDADAMDKYVREELHVPTCQIVNLRNESATRSAIIRELLALRTRKSIHIGDPILIFFAGHGASALTPKGWESGSTIMSMIVPCDSLVTDSVGIPIYPIPDRTIGALLHELSEIQDGSGKGDNITVIFDCCHSGSGTRCLAYKPRRLQRGFELTKAIIPPALDQDIWGRISDDRALSVAAGFATSGCRSHVFLAACRESEKAYEENGRGAFTQALLDTLRAMPTDALTYRDLIERLPKLPNQTPQCEGHNCNRLLFNALAPSTVHVVYQVIEKNGKYVMDAGTLHGIAIGARFSLHPSRHCNTSAPPVPIMVANAVHAFSTELANSTPIGAEPTLSSPCFASQVSIGDTESMYLHIPSSERRCPVMRDLVKALSIWQEMETHVVLVRREEQACLGIRSRNGCIDYLIHDPMITNLGLHRLYEMTTAHATSIRTVLRAAARFFRHLHRAPERSRFSRHIDVQIHELRQDVYSDLDLNLRPSYRAYGDDVLHSGVLDIEAAGRTVYGIRIRSALGVSLHIWVFFFDCSDLSINYYQPPALGRNGEAPLPARGSLTIGYGAGGGVPFRYFLRPRQDRDVGFIKLFISTEPVDLSYIMQSSPFDASSSRGCGRAELRPMHSWDSIVIPVVQRRKPRDV